VRRALWATILGLGFALGGLFIGHGFASGRATDRYVEVKGDTSSVQLQALEVSDAFANRFPGERGGPRFVIQQTVMVRSGKPDVVLQASQRVSELVGAGVVLSSSGEYGIGGPTFVFTRLNELKPAMVKAATANARTAAEQFAADSRTDLGGIRHANQGVFVILPRDQAPGVNEGAQLQKIVRVVSTVQYFLQ
jgi:uncharacterized protein